MTQEEAIAHKNKYEAWRALDREAHEVSCTIAALQDDAAKYPNVLDTIEVKGFTTFQLKRSEISELLLPRFLKRQTEIAIEQSQL